MLNNRHITLIIPALNEAQSIGCVISELPDYIDRTIVIDNGSEDQTAAVAMASGAEVIREDSRGYGAACQAGIRAAGDTDLLAFIDADFSDHPGDLDRVISPVADGRCDFALGSRETGNARRALSWHQRIGNNLLCRLMNARHQTRYRDFGPMRCISRQALQSLRMQDRDFGWTAEMQVKAAHASLRVIEIPVSYRHRIGRSKISGTLRGSVMAGYRMSSWIFKTDPPARPRAVMDPCVVPESQTTVPLRQP